MANCEHKQPCGIRHCVDLRDVKADLARITAERDALRAEVEAMRAQLLAIIEVARPFENWRGDNDDDDTQLSALCDAVAQAIIALRTRKVGG